MEITTRVWLDDCRPAPVGWVRVKTAPSAITVLRNCEVSHLSLDHDLGEEPGIGNGYDVLLWIEEEVAYNESYQPPEVITVHSDNAGARPRMFAAIESIKRLMARRRG